MTAGRRVMGPLVTPGGVISYDYDASDVRVVEQKTE